MIQLGKVKRRVELQWLPLRREGENAGELLAAFELEPYKGERRPPFVPGIGERGQTVIPERVAPKMERYTIEVIIIIICLTASLPVKFYL